MPLMVRSAMGLLGRAGHQPASTSVLLPCRSRFPTLPSLVEELSRLGYDGIEWRGGLQGHVHRLRSGVAANREGADARTAKQPPQPFFRKW